MSTSNGPRRGLLIVDHGTRNPTVNARLGDFAREVGIRMPDWSVAHAHMELGEPDLSKAVEALVSEGITEIHIHPHFLSAGYHVTTSIPELVESAKRAHPRVVFELREALGEDNQLVDLVVLRISDSNS